MYIILSKNHEVEAEVEKPWPTQRDLCPTFKVLLRGYVLIRCLKALATRNI